MPRKKQAVSRPDRLILSVQVKGQVHEIEATDARDLEEKLLAILPHGELKNARAVARLITNGCETLTIEMPTWTIRRQGVLRYLSNEELRASATPLATRSAETNARETLSEGLF